MLHEYAQNETNRDEKKPKYTFHMSNLGRKLNERQLKFSLFAMNGAKQCEMHFKVQCAWALEMLGITFFADDILSVYKNSPQLNFIRGFFRHFDEGDGVRKGNSFVFDIHTPANVINDMTMVTSMTSATKKRTNHIVRQIMMVKQRKNTFFQDDKRRSAYKQGQKTHNGSNARG